VRRLELASSPSTIGADALVDREASAPDSVVTSIHDLTGRTRPSAALRCRGAGVDCTENASFCSRVMPHFSAMSSAEMPCGTSRGTAMTPGPNGMLPGRN